MYIQLSSPKKTVCTVVIYENIDSIKRISFILPYFNNRTIGAIIWGTNTNDLFIYSSDTGFTVYRIINDNWLPFYIRAEDNQDGTLSYFLCRNDNITQQEERYELSVDTIPLLIKNSSKFRKYIDKV